MTKEKYPEGHFVGKWMGIFIAIFAGVGVPLSASTGNHAFIGIGPAIGVAVGAAVGKSVEDKYRREGKIRPLTKEEKKRKMFGVYAGIGLLMLGVVMFALLYFLK